MTRLVSRERNVSESNLETYKEVFSEISGSDHFDVFVMVDGNEIIGCYQNDVLTPP